MTSDEWARVWKRTAKHERRERAAFRALWLLAIERTIVLTDERDQSQKCAGRDDERAEASLQERQDR